MQHTFNVVGWIRMSSWMGRLNATALIDGDVDNDRAVRNILQHISRNQLWCRSPRNQDGPNNQIRLRDGIVNHVSTRGERRDLRQKNIVKLAQPVQIVI